MTAAVNWNFPADEFWGWVPAIGPTAGQETSLQMQHWNVAVWGGSRFSLPTLRGQDIEHPYRAGKQWRAKYPDSKTCTLGMWTAGVNAVTGLPDTADQRLAFNNNLQQLRALFWQRGANGSVQGQLVRRWWLTQQGLSQIVVARAMAEIAGSMEPTNMGRTSAAFSVDLLLADPYFAGVGREQSVGTSGGVLFGLGEGVVGENYPSPVNSFTVELTTGPVTVSNTTAGVSFAYNGTIANPPLVIDVLNSTATDAAGNNLISGITHQGARMWMCIAPGSNNFTVSAGTATFSWNDLYV
jgi:hypothetical protein